MTSSAWTRWRPLRAWTRSVRRSPSCLPGLRKQLELGPDPTPADVAVMVRLHASDILENKHAETLLVSKRSLPVLPAR